MIFRNEYWFLSNMYPTKITVNGLTYSCVESAFQSFKLENKNKRKMFCELNGFEAKKAGRKIPLRSDWNEIKDQVMYLIVKAKFKQNPQLQQLLLNTGNLELVEDNSWNDFYWGRCNGRGQNKLGEILMKVRAELKK